MNERKVTIKCCFDELYYCSSMLTTQRMNMMTGTRGEGKRARERRRRSAEDE